MDFHDEKALFWSQFKHLPSGYIPSFSAYILHAPELLDHTIHKFLKSASEAFKDLAKDKKNL